MILGECSWRHAVSCAGTASSSSASSIDRASELGEQYLHKQLDNVFYREATFYSAPEVQTLSQQLDEIVEIDPIRAGHGRSLFVVVRASLRRSVPDA